MKKWYRSTLVKAALTVMIIITAITLSLGVVLLAGYQGEGLVSPEDILQFGKGRYEDSAAFSGRMQQVTYNVMDEIAAKNRLETEDGKYDPNRLVDIMEYEETLKITGKNTSGLAYSLKELEEWGDQWNTGDYEMTDIVVCQKPDGTYYYYYLDEFEKLLRDQELKVELPYAEEEESHSDTVWTGELIEMLKSGFSPMNYYGENLIVQDAENKVVYKDFWPFQQGIEEKKSPQGAGNILEVVNRTPELNGKLDEVYHALETALSSVTADIEVYKQSKNIWTEGNTNFQYLLADTESKRVYTNNSAYTDYKNIESSIEKMKAIGNYVVVKPKLADFESNMDVSAADWKNIVESYGEISGKYVFAAAVDTEYPVQDLFYTSAKEYGKYAPYLKCAAVVSVCSIILFLTVLVWLTVCAGRHPEDEELHLNAFDRWKTILGAAAVILPWVLMTWFVSSMWTGIGYQALPYTSDQYQHGYLFYTFSMTITDVIVLSLYTGMTAALFLTGYLSLVRRIKGRTLWKNSLLRWSCGIFGGFWRHRSVCVRSVLLIGGFILVHWLALLFYWAGTFPFVALMIIVDAAALFLGIRAAIEKEQIRKGIKEIASGNVNYQIPLEKMHGESREMGELVNSIGNGLNHAVASAMKSERLKTDLITNVSHDIKTPLTSIINYVDLLKRENLQDPKIQGYLEVLEAKAQRLKTLTEDVVEASKVSSGNISLEMMNVNLVEMVNQTIGEFSEKMEAKNLTVVASLPEEPAIVYVDGRRMWRVLENIFNNAAKYALPGTRVYADLRVKDSGSPEKKTVVFSLKNVSENPLNINAEELTERFIRGDVSRGTEGSGLGLSIARDLTEMQGGTFKLYVDGDLFKVMIEF